MNHLAIDLETLSLEPNAHILSIVATRMLEVVR